MECSVDLLVIGHYDEGVHDSSKVLNSLQGLLHPPPALKSEGLRHHTFTRDGDRTGQDRTGQCRDRIGQQMDRKGGSSLEQERGEKISAG